jgi:hypothetical protein
MSLQDITYTDKKDTRSGFGVGIHEAGKANPKCGSHVRRPDWFIKAGKIHRRFSGTLRANWYR